MDGYFGNIPLPAVDLAAAPAGVIAEARERATIGVQQFRPRVLLLNMSAAQLQAIRYARSRTAWHRVVGYGTMGRHAIEEIDAFGLSWLQHCAYVYRYLEADPELRAARERLHQAGIVTRWMDEEEIALRSYAIAVQVDDASIAIVRALAKQEAGIVTPEASADYDRRFDLYLKQNYAEDWEAWRQRAPLVEWP
ncbi:hypothetical protein FHS95_001266 [Sphingomonas naasensis]|uniref:Uncharacterized protein n=1 Tax=Sphingomonas naasensis TaxID=1344951 RepID=A0A4S1W6M1_9SPHN|nr:hypothetical protein [Sphingomonas naasensis]NIJ19597.1 hypothetical protein [Sphingomonas naasensis]TGX37325.1 hypothetical protein E5A74_20495 [Sphingomonas naasensis]